jgi:hypothetical protein
LEGLGKRKWLAFTLAAVILPISLLTTFKLTGIIPEPVAPETTTVDAVSWNITRPLNPMGGFCNIGKTVENTYVNNEVNVKLRVVASAYEHNPDPVIGPFFGRDGVILAIYADFSIPKGFGVSLVIKYLPTDNNATIYVSNAHWAVIQENVTVTDIKWFGTDDSEAYTDARILNSPSHLETQSYWVFDDKNSMDHTLIVTLEATYFNGATYRRIALPVITGIIPEPVAPETTTADAVNLNITRPLNPMGGYCNISKTVENSYINDEVDVKLRVDAAVYGQFFRKDGVFLAVFVDFSIPKGLGVSLVVKYLPTDNNATIYYGTSDHEVVQENVYKVIDENVTVTSLGTNDVEAEISNSPCHLGIYDYWVFNDKNSMDHTLIVTLEATYFNGATYRRIVLPVTLQILIPTG